MIITIDGKPLTIPFPCGVKRYASELLTNPAQIDSDNHYIVFLPKDTFVPHAKNIHKYILSGTLPWQIRFNRALRAKNIDIVHLLQQHGSIFLQHNAVITTVHDLAPQNAYPSFVRDPYYSILGRYVHFVRDRVLRRTSRVIAVSEFTKSQLLTYYPKAQVDVIYEGVSRVYTPSLNPSRSVGLLTLADFSPRKNVMRVIDAYSQLPPTLLHKHPLHIVASTHKPVERLQKELIRKKIIQYTHIHIALSDKKLAYLYAHAVAFIYPSLYEGFGLPILEAMACGCPVITSNLTATDEIGGSAALRINPYSTSELFQSIHSIITNTSMHKKFRNAGIKRAKQFSWMKTAQQTLSVYQNVYNQHL